MSTTPSLTTLNKVGLVLASVLGVSDIASAFVPTPEGAQGPPLGILLLGGLLGVVTIVAAVAALRTGARRAVRIVAVTRVVSVITSLPAFFVDIPAGLRIAAGVGVVVTIAVVVMVLTPARRSELVLD